MRSTVVAGNLTLQRVPPVRSDRARVGSLRARTNRGPEKETFIASESCLDKVLCGTLDCTWTVPYGTFTWQLLAEAHYGEGSCPGHRSGRRNAGPDRSACQRNAAR